MGITELRKHRLLAGLSQTQVAKSLKISQSTYQRWESGAQKIPDTKRKQLANLLEVRSSQLDSDVEEFDFLGIDKEMPDDKRYFGEVAVHFASNVQPLMSPISFAERDRLADLGRTGAEFFTFSTLDNWTVVLRVKSISDIYLSSDAYDEYGPESERYVTHMGLLPSEKFWTVVENWETPDLIDGVSPEIIREAMACLEFDEKTFEEAIDCGHASIDDRSEIVEEISKDAPKLIQRATMLTWQCDSGIIRHEFVDSDEALSEALSRLDMTEESDGELLRIHAEGWHRTILVNPSSLCYMAFPSHRINRAELEQLADDIDGSANLPL